MNREKVNGGERDTERQTRRNDGFSSAEKHFPNFTNDLFNKQP